MSSIFSDLREGLREGLNVIVKKTEHFAKLGKLNIDLIGIRREIEQLFTELGGRTFELLSQEKGASVADDEEVKQLVAKLKELEKKLAVKKEEKTAFKEKGQDNL